MQTLLLFKKGLQKNISEFVGNSRARATVRKVTHLFSISGAKKGWIEKLMGSRRRIYITSAHTLSQIFTNNLFSAPLFGLTPLKKKSPHFRADHGQAPNTEHDDRELGVVLFFGTSTTLCNEKQHI